MNLTFKKTSYNFWFGILGQVVTIICGILVPRFFIISFGSELNGFINSINQLFVYLSFLEAGVGSASLQALYTPVAQNDKNAINGILSATDYFYRRTGFFYTASIVVISFVYPILTKTSLGYFSMVVVILFSGLGGALSYFFQGKYLLLLQAEGKSYISTNLATASTVILNVGKIVFLLLGYNILVVQGLYLLLSAFRSLVTIVYVRRNYGWINTRSSPDFSATEQKNSVLLHQLASLVFNNTDVLLLTIFTDLQTVSIYSVYKYLFSLISTFISNCTNSISFKLGQLFHERDKFLPLFEIYETLHITLTFCLCTVAYNFMHPFLALYTAGLDINYLLPYMPLLTISIEILTYGRASTNSVITYAAHFKKTQNRAIVEMVINLLSSIVLVQILGIYGVLIGTILALLYRVNDIILYANRKILNRNSWKTYQIWVVNIVIAFINVCLFRFFDFDLGSYTSLILNAALFTVISVPLFFVTIFLCNRKIAQIFKQLLCVVLKKG